MANCFAINSLETSEKANIQETGRAGRDGKMSCALLFVSKSDLSAKGRLHTVSSSMLKYCEGQACMSKVFPVNRI